MEGAVQRNSDSCSRTRTLIGVEKAMPAGVVAGRRVQLPYAVRRLGCLPFR